MSTANRIVGLMEMLARHGPLGTRAISRKLGVPAASTHRLLHELESEQVMERNEADEWELSYRLLQITGLQLARLRTPALVHPFLEQIAADTRETAFFAIPSGNEIVYLDKVQTEMQLQMSVQLGTRRPMHCTGLGKAMLAFLPPARQRRILSAGELHAYTSNSITDPILLAQELNTIRSQGYATDREEIILGVNCIAVPLLNYADSVVGAISIAGTGPSVSNTRFNALVEIMLEVGAEVSKRLGHIERTVENMQSESRDDTGAQHVQIESQPV